VLTGVDLAILWGDLGIGLLVLVTGALLVPGLGFAAALGAIVVGSVIGVAMLALAGYIGARHGVPTMVLFRPVLGIRGSWFPSILNALQLIGWTAVEFWAMSSVFDIVVRHVFGFSARPLWLAVTAVACTALALWGPVGVARVYMRRFGAWLIVLIGLVVTGLVIASGGIGAALSAPGKGGFPTFGAAVDLVISMPVSWLPLVADYNRFARRPTSALAGTWWGYLVANIWLYGLGVLLVLGAGAAPSPAGIAAAILSIAGGSVAGIVFLVGLLVGETDEAFADMYSGAVSLQNVFPRFGHRTLVVSIAALAGVLAGFLTMGSYETFLFLLGSVFVPLFGVLAAEYFFGRSPLVSEDELFDRSGRYWFSGGWRLASFVPWVVGFLVYHWIAPTGPSWWVNLAGHVFGTPLSIRYPWLAASVPSFLAAFVLGVAASRSGSGRISSVRSGRAETGTE
jgi:putative hydroxymethylpyrimidine transporter CytX